MNIARLAYLLFLFISFTVYSAAPKNGFWQGILELNSTTDLPFVFKLDQDQQLTIYNAEEQITLSEPQIKGDSISYSFIAFNTSLTFSINVKKELNGYFINPDRKKYARIPFRAYFIDTKKPSCSKQTSTDLSGTWKTTFSSGSENAYPAIGKFNQQENGRVTGTFLTETGDYRYLDGYLSNDRLTISCFDGSHAFLFKAKIKEGKLEGTFYSGRHWKTNWVAERDDNFKLKDPDSLTYLIDNSFTFAFPDSDKNIIQFPNSSTKGKVVIIQIIGTWCPNCLDETNFYLELYDKYHNEGLEILGVAYEAPSNFKEQAERVDRYIKNKSVPYPILIGGQASKKEASEDFNMLNEISSFPTSIFINRSGEVIKIHTGFNGPGTKEIYEAYVKETHQLIEKLLRE